MIMRSIAFIRILCLNYLIWLVLGLRANTIAHETTKLHRSNATYYQLKESLIKVIARGSSLAVNQCKDQFRWERWNCPQSSFYRNDEGPVTRERAFVSSITAAGIVYAVTRACAKGSLPSCGCSSSKNLPIIMNLDTKFASDGMGRVTLNNEDSDSKHHVDDVNSNDGTSTTGKTHWSWGGCSHDVTFGDKVAKTFFNSLHGGQEDVLAQAHKHNNRLGRRLVRDNIRPECKCHGISGSCSTKTCWFRMAPFGEISNTLKHRYLRAQRIHMNTAARYGYLNIPESQMVFLQESPDYCVPDSTTGWKGTGGRVCSRAKDGATSAERRSCKELCRSCGHQVRQRPLKVTWHCNCTFHWCCEVKCGTCTKTLIQHYCDDTPKHF